MRWSELILPSQREPASANETPCAKLRKNLVESSDDKPLDTAMGRASALPRSFQSTGVGMLRERWTGALGCVPYSYHGSVAKWGC